MAICSAGRGTVYCSGGCVVIDVPGAELYATCSDNFFFDGPGGVLKASDRVEVCAKEMPSSQLDELLQHLVGTPLVRSQDSERSGDETVDVTYTGTTDELLEHLGLSRETGGAAA